MYILGSNIKNVQVFSLQTGQPVAKVLGPLIDPANLEIVAFSVITGPRRPAVLLSRDLRRLTGDTAVIDSDEDLSSPDDIVRLQEIIRKRFNLPGLQVVNESGQKLGKITDYVVGLASRKVTKIYVKPPFLKSVLSSNLIIDRAQIVDVTPKKITVRDASLPEPALGINSVAAE